MADFQLALDLVLTALLAATLVYAVRLERALRRLKRDRGALDTLLSGFDANTRQAEAGIGKLRGLSQEVTAQLAKQGELGHALKDDLVFLIDRGDRLADRMEALVRAARPLAAEPPPRPAEAAPTQPRSQAERALLTALKAAR